MGRKWRKRRDEREQEAKRDETSSLDEKEERVERVVAAAQRGAVEVRWGREQSRLQMLLLLRFV